MHCGEFGTGGDLKQPEMTAAAPAMQALNGSRREFDMFRSAAVLAAFLIVTGPAPAADRPNVLVVLTDDMRWDALGVVQKEQGKAALFPWFKTPNLDRLAAEGVRFANAFCTTSFCSPSRASLLSGQYAHRHKVLNNFTDYPNDLPSYPKSLQAAGYEIGPLSSDTSSM